MLVLSRRANESIVLPQLDISVTVLKVCGNFVKIGVQAPRDIEILRGEIVRDAHYDLRSGLHTLTRDEFHEWKNRLNALNLTAQLLQRQRAAGLREMAELTVQRLLAELQKFTAEAKCSAQSSATTTHYSVLLVEDDANERELLAGLLRMTGCKVSTVSDGLEAVEYLRTNAAPDVVLMDMQMPRCNGGDAIKRLRADPSLTGLRVFAVSACPPSEYGVTVGRDGVEHWFPKPLQAEEIAREIGRLTTKCVSV